MLIPGKHRIATLRFSLAAATLASAFILACAGGPEFNPLPPASVSPSTTPTPTHTSVSGVGSPTAVATEAPQSPGPDSAFPTPTQGLLIFEPTPAPPSPILDPAEYVMASMRQLEWRESLSVRSKVTLDAVVDAEDAVTGPDLSVQVEGEYEMVPVALPIIRNGVQLVVNYPSFHLLFFNQTDAGGETARPPDAELEAVENRFVTNTTGHNFKIHETLRDLLDDLYPGQRPNMAIFLSLALSGGRIVDTDLRSWMSFAQNEVRLTGTDSLDGDRFRVFEASRTRLNRDVEEWTFWTGSVMEGS